MSARNYGEPRSYPVDATDSFDARGYVVVADQGGDNRVHKHASGTAADYDGTNPVIGVNFKSTEDQDGIVQNLAAGDEISVVTESAAFPVRGEAETYNLGDPIYLSQNNDGRVNKSNTSSAQLGVVVEAVDHSGGNATDSNEVLVAFDLA